MDSPEWWECLLERENIEEDASDDDLLLQDLMFDPLNIVSPVELFSPEVFDSTSVYNTREVSPVPILHASKRKVVRTIRNHLVDVKATIATQRTTPPRKRNKSFPTDRSSKRKKKKPRAKTAIEGCRCGKNRCLKLYCVCLAAGKPCGPACQCTGCCNRGKQHDRMVRTKQKAGKIVDGAHTTGCRCTRSRCIKNYCECFHANAYCGPNCKCKGCDNHPKSKFLHRLHPREPGKVGPRQLGTSEKKKP